MIKGLLRNKKKKGDLIVSEILLQTKALTKQYGHQKAVDNVDIHIKKRVQSMDLSAETVPARLPV